MDGSLNGKKFSREKAVSVKKIVHGFYEWQKTHPGKDFVNKAHADTLLAEILRFQKRDNMPERELAIYGFDVDALKEGILRASHVKITKSEIRGAHKPRGV